MTSNRGAGFSSAPRTAGKFDPLGVGRSALAPASGLLAQKGEASPEQVARDMEKRVHALLEESAAAHGRGEQQLGGVWLPAAQGFAPLPPAPRAPAACPGVTWISPSPDEPSCTIRRPRPSRRGAAWLLALTQPWRRRSRPASESAR
jgi:hypothetical protein